MRGVAEQRRAAFAPALDRIAVGGRPALPRGRLVEQLPRPVADLGEVRHDLVARAFAHAPFLRLPAVEGDDDVVLLATAQRVVDEVAIRADPDRRRVPAQVGGHLGVRDDRAVDDVPRHAVARRRCSRSRTTECTPSQPTTAAPSWMPPLASTSRTPCSSTSTRTMRAEVWTRDVRGELNFLVDRLVDVGAVDDRVRIVEAPAERLARPARARPRCRRSRPS